MSTDTAADAVEETNQVRLTRPSAHVALITLDNPPRNQLTFEARAAYARHLQELNADESVRCLVVTGAGVAFTAGNDLRQGQQMTTVDLSDYRSGFDAILDGMEKFRAPVVAAINGAAAGGGLEFALCCDIRIASTEALFIAAGVNVGLIANFYRLTRVVGEGPAKDLLLTGRRWNAEDALRWGLVTGVHQPDQLLDAALAVAERVATRAPLSVEATKSAVHEVRHATAEEARRIQGRKIAEMFATEDHQEAVRAFFEKRDGNYQRR